MHYTLKKEDIQDGVIKSDVAEFIDKISVI